METKRYYRADLELMTTHQLREICRREKIINGILNPLDKEELVHVIVRYRGAEEHSLLTECGENELALLSDMLSKVSLRPIKSEITGVSKITVFDGIAVAVSDGILLSYDKRFSGTNALIVSGERQVCGIFNAVLNGESAEQLYLTKSKESFCRVLPGKRYSLWLFDRDSSDSICRAVGEETPLPGHLNVLEVPLLDFVIRRPAALNIPIVVDFGTSNTVAGAYLDGKYFEETGRIPGENILQKDEPNYTEIIPSVVAVKAIHGGVPELVFGAEAVKLANSSYADEGFCVFYDIKRWVTDFEKREELFDRAGNYAQVSRKEMIRQFLFYALEAVRTRFKCETSKVYIPSPVNQKHLFRALFLDIMPGVYTDYSDILDEGTAVLYNTISDRIRSESYRDGSEERALIIDCGGVTTDLSSCAYTAWNRRVSYKIDIRTSFENGDTNFGGNNLTYRVMQLIKLELAAKISPGKLRSASEVLSDFDIDIYRAVDELGAAEVYAGFDAEYALAESVVPTRYRHYELRQRGEYFKVRNNYHYLFALAERVKREFFDKVGVLKVRIAGEQEKLGDGVFIQADKWKLSVVSGGALGVLKDVPEIVLNIIDLEFLLKADIYSVTNKFFAHLFECDELGEYDIIKLSGQSVKIGGFADTLKEFIPGKIINFRRRTRNLAGNYELKMTCVSGALKYLRDKLYGYADISVENESLSIPYMVTAFTHTGREVTLIQGLSKGEKCGSVSRNAEDLTLELFVRDADNFPRHSYTLNCGAGAFSPTRYEQILDKYGKKIPQDETDIIVDKEVKFFVWAVPSKWGFNVVPVSRNGETLMLGREEFFTFENDAWLRNFYDGAN